jgi:WD40 repeat protein
VGSSNRLKANIHHFDRRLDKEVRTVQPNGDVVPLSFLFLGDYLLSGSGMGNLRIWDSELNHISKHKLPGGISELHGDANDLFVMHYDPSSQTTQVLRYSF